MWKNWRKKVNDLFFREIEIEIEEDEREHLVEKEQDTPSTQQTRNMSLQQHLHEESKVFYQYPKNNKQSFKFPVISDDQKERHRQQRHMRNSQRQPTDQRATERERKKRREQRQ